MNPKIFRVNVCVVLLFDQFQLFLLLHHKLFYDRQNGDGDGGVDGDGDGDGGVDVSETDIHHLVKLYC